METEREKRDYIDAKRGKESRGKGRKGGGWRSLPAALKVQELNQLNNERKAKD